MFQQQKKLWCELQIESWIFDINWMKFREFFITSNFSIRSQHNPIKTKQKHKTETCIIPKLCNTKYKAFKLRNPSVILGSAVDSIYGSSVVTAMTFSSARLSLLFFFAMSLNIWSEANEKARQWHTQKIKENENITTQLLNNETFVGNFSLR